MIWVHMHWVLQLLSISGISLCPWYNPWDRYYHESHFADQETEAQKGYTPTIKTQNRNHFPRVCPVIKWGWMFEKLMANSWHHSHAFHRTRKSSWSILGKGGLICPQAPCLPVVTLGKCSDWDDTVGSTSHPKTNGSPGKPVLEWVKWVELSTHSSFCLDSNILHSMYRWQ
jgi:hypothetical protein